MRVCVLHEAVPDRLEDGADGLERADDVRRAIVDYRTPSEISSVENQLSKGGYDIHIGSMCAICLPSTTRIGEPAAVLFVTHHASFCQYIRIVPASFQRETHGKGRECRQVAPYHTPF